MREVLEPLFVCKLRTGLRARVKERVMVGGMGGIRVIRVAILLESVSGGGNSGCRGFLGALRVGLLRVIEELDHSSLFFGPSHV